MDYQILQVSAHGRKLVAVLPLSTVMGNELNQKLREDYLRLAESGPESVELDLRAVEFIDGSFFTHVIELRKSLQQRSATLNVRVGASLKEVLEITKLDQFLGMIRDSDG